MERTDFFYNVCCKQLEECRKQLLKVPPFEAANSKQKGCEGIGPVRYAEWSSKFARARAEPADSEGESKADTDLEFLKPDRCQLGPAKSHQVNTNGKNRGDCGLAGLV